MSRYDFNAQRLFVEADLGEGASLTLGGDQANYLRNVLRLDAGDAVLVFNGRDGEWRAELARSGKREARLAVTRAPAARGRPDIAYLFAPLKRSRLDYMVQKATEMGVARLCPC
jgi:16S rRNA (uracil1498-N3)-methyltransferase